MDRYSIYFVYGTGYDNVLAIFPHTATGLSHANTFIGANGGTLAEGEITTPFFVAVVPV
jgi:hypothetical protein